MSGYLGDPDAEAAHAMILAENGVHDATLALQGPVQSWCTECGETIPPARVAFALRKGIRCTTCVTCQAELEQQPQRRTRMLDWIL